VRTLRFYEHDDQDVLLDLGDKGDSPGDRYTYAGNLFDRIGSLPYRGPRARSMIIIGACTLHV
jgi:hypothetical protein